MIDTGDSFWALSKRLLLRLNSYIHEFALQT